MMDDVLDYLSSQENHIRVDLYTDQIHVDGHLLARSGLLCKVNFIDEEGSHLRNILPRRIVLIEAREFVEMLWSLGSVHNLEIGERQRPRMRFTAYCCQEGVEPWKILERMSALVKPETSTIWRFESQ